MEHVKAGRICSSSCSSSRVMKWRGLVVFVCSSSSSGLVRKGMEVFVCFTWKCFHVFGF